MHYIKKHIPKTNRITKRRHLVKECPGDIYYLGFQKLPDFEEEREVWVCMETGKLLFKKPKLREEPSASKKKSPVVKKPTVAEKPSPQKITKPKSEKPSITKGSDIPISEVKGIGAKAQEQLKAIKIETIAELLAKDSDEIAKLLGRKSDTQIKKWQENARLLIS